MKEVVAGNGALAAGHATRRPHQPPGGALPFVLPARQPGSTPERHPPKLPTIMALLTLSSMALSWPTVSDISDLFSRPARRALSHAARASVVISVHPHTSGNRWSLATAAKRPAPDPTPRLPPPPGPAPGVRKLMTARAAGWCLSSAAALTKLSARRFSFIWREGGRKEGGV